MLFIGQQWEAQEGSELTDEIAEVVPLANKAYAHTLCSICCWQPIVLR